MLPQKGGYVLYDSSENTTFEGVSFQIIWCLFFHDIWRDRVAPAHFWRRTLGPSRSNSAEFTIWVKYRDQNAVENPMLSLRDKIHSSAEALLKLTLMGARPYRAHTRIARERVPALSIFCRFSCPS